MIGNHGTHASTDGDSASPDTIASGATNQTTTKYAIFCSGLGSSDGGIFHGIKCVRSACGNDLISSRVGMSLTAQRAYASAHSTKIHAKKMCQRRPSAKSCSDGIVS